MIRKVLTSFLASSCFLFFGCSRSNDQADKTARLYLQADPLSFDPRVAGDRRSQTVLRELFEGLTRYSSTRKIELVVASSYTISDDGLVYTFTIAPNWWSNGTKVTAYDFAYSWKSVLDPTFSSQFAHAFYVIKNAKLARLGKVPIDDVGIRAIDANTLEVTLENPSPYFLELTSNTLYAPVYQPGADKDKNWSTKVGSEFICNGPYRIKNRVAKSHILLERNPHYKNADTNQLQFLSFSIIEDPNTAYSLFKKGELDWIGDPCGSMPLDVLQSLDKEKKLIKEECDKLYLMAVGTGHKHLQSPSIRKAIATACNRQALCSQLLKGSEKPAFSILPTGITQLTSPLFEDNNVNEARKLFALGLKEIGMTKEEYPGIVLSYWSDPTEKAVAQALQMQIQNALEIPVRMEGYDWPAYFKKIFLDKTLEIGAIGWWPWINDPISTLEVLKFPDNGMNGTKWQNGKFIELLDNSDHTLDKAERKAFLKKAEELVVSELPFIPLFTMPYKYAKAEGLEGESLTSNGLMEFKGLYKKSTKEIPLKHR
jgi:oligopeptide transport system substrate-binding protein